MQRYEGRVLMSTRAERAGFTLIELMVTIVVFAILASAALAGFSALAKAVKAAREKTVLSALASEYLEHVRNMPYSQIGTINGNPSGLLADYTNPVTKQIESFSYKIYYEVTYQDDPADGTILAGGDSAPNDYKQVKMSVLNTATGQITAFFTTVAPKGLEGISNAGAILIKVFNAQGQPVSDASIHMVNTLLNPDIILDRESDSSGQWIEVGLPASVNGYQITVTKPGYSSDQTYPITAQNPNPTKPHATVVNGQVTEISFFIDLLSNLNIRTLDEVCQPLSGVNVNVRGAKLIGLNPTVYKFNQSYSSVAGLIGLNNIEWDTYTPTLLAGQSYVVRGTSPIQKIDVLPGTSQTFTMILGSNTTAYSMLVIVKDAATGAALEGAAVHLRKGGSVPQDYYGTTGGSVWVQYDWSGGSGQADWAANSDRYFQDNGNIDINSMPTGVRLKKVSGDHLSPGWLESSTFDTGTSASNFTTLTWEPTSQDPATTLKFQIATSNSSAGPWNYKGPDGTAATYYTVSGSSIHAVHDNSRYVRFKAFLETNNSKRTPILTSLNINYVSGCFTPGQFWFGDLTAGNNYDLDVTLAGYQTEVLPNLNVQGNTTTEVLMSP